MILVPRAGHVRERDPSVAAARIDRPAVADVGVDVVDRPVVVAVVEQEVAGADLVPADLLADRRHRRRGPLRQRPPPARRAGGGCFPHPPPPLSPPPPGGPGEAPPADRLVPAAVPLRRPPVP